MKLALAAVGLLAVASARSVRRSAPSPAYAPTPIGWILSRCLTEVPRGASVTRLDSGDALVEVAGGKPYVVPACVGSEAEPVYRPHGLSPRGAAGGRELQLPKDYKGWIEYANVTSPNMTSGFESFTSVFTTPGSLPASPPDELFLFPGLQNIDWIPLVDPEPTAAFDIIQPVIQYPADGGNYWSVKSWWVTLDKGAMYSAELALQPGDAIFGNMTKTGASEWFIGSLNQRTGESTNIVAKGLGARLRSQPWAYVTLECYGCDSCATYPAGNASCAFSEMAFTTVDGTPFEAEWQANAKPDPNKFCHESIELVNATNVNIFFDN